MKLKLAFFAAALAALGACNNTAAPERADVDSSAVAEDETAVTVPQVDEDFPQLFDALQAADRDFSVENFEGGEAGTRPDSLYRSIDTADLRPFLPYLIYNADSSLALDLVTRNYVPVTKNGKTVLEEGGPDFQIGLINMKKRQRKRLLFFGTTGAIFDAKWENDGAVVMAGTDEWSGSDSLRPVLWRYDEPSKSWQVFPYQKMVAGDWHLLRKKW